MDGRWKLGFASGLVLSSLMGCTTTKPEMPAALEPLPTPPPSSNTVFVPEPTESTEEKTGPLASSTLVIFGNMWVDAVAKDPNKPAAEREKLLTQARQVYQDVLSREPKNVDALLGLGRMYHVTGEIEKLREIEQRATTLHPQDPKVWAWVAIRQAQAKNFDVAVESYHKAVKLDPENRMYRIHLGFTLARAGRYAEGYEWLSRSMREAEARFNLAQMMIHNGDVEKAKMELRLSMKADPNFRAAGDQLASLDNPNAGPARDIRTMGHEQMERR